MILYSSSEQSSQINEIVNGFGQTKGNSTTGEKKKKKRRRKKKTESMEEEEVIIPKNKKANTMPSCSGGNTLCFPSRA